MANASDYWKNGILEFTYRAGAFTAPTSLLLAVSTTAISSDGTGLTEPVGNAYTRAAAVFDASAAGIILNQLVTFVQATGAWGTLTDFALFDQAGNMLAFDVLTAPVVVGNLDTLRFQPGQLPVSLQ